MAQAEAPATSGVTPSKKRRKKKREPILVFLSKAIVLTTVLVLVAFLALTRFTFSIDPQYFAGVPSSLPWGVWITDTHDHDVARGDFLSFTTDDRQIPYFDPGTDFVKVVAGMPGDHVVVDAGTVQINGHVVGQLSPDVLNILGTSTATYDRDFTIPAAHYWVMGTNPISFDSRYWGTVPADQIVGESYPLWPWFVHDTTKDLLP